MDYMKSSSPIRYSRKRLAGIGLIWGGTLKDLGTPLVKLCISDYLCSYFKNCVSQLSKTTVKNPKVKLTVLADIQFTVHLTSCDGQVCLHYPAATHGSTMTYDTLSTYTTV